MKGLLAAEDVLEQALTAEVYKKIAFQIVHNFSELLVKLHSKLHIQPSHKGK
jgi:hypothetical protein